MPKELTTLFTGQEREVLDDIDSTNTYMAELLKKRRIPEGFLVSALQQSAGRGQAHAKWKSEAGMNLLLSFVFYPSFVSIPDLFMVNKAISLGTSDLVKKMTGEKVSIKWPNDIYHGDRKIAGILMENSLNTSQIQQCIVGIGLNVNQDDFPKELPNPTSLKLITGRKMDRDEVLNELCSCLEHRYLQLKRNEYADLDREFTNSLYRKDEWHLFISERVEFEGMIKGVDKRGRMLVMHRNEIERFYDLKEIKFIM
ncbi:MAG: biotin--[acetyl-CoA-carboxylase] ligase [Bacteroidetes bacterium]|nr:MAG: biotin--[acetyl-CoA-carboxylase] ligase [Bacteroidota bacterium]